MTQDLRVALITSLNDQLVGPLRRSLDEVEKNFKRVEDELKKTDKTGQQLGQTLANMHGPAQAAKEVANLSRNTENALRLADRLKAAWSQVGNLTRGVAAGVAGFQAAKYVMAPDLQTARSYDRQLADAANTAFSDRDLAGRRAGMGELNAAVNAALRAGGGKREDVLAALNEMLASGVVAPNMAQRVLPTVASYATSGNANVTELSNIVVRALQNGFKEADIPKVLDMALAAGQKGGFELKDMAKWLPKLLAAGRMSGLDGMEGYARILASAQGSVITAGSKDEAGNNLLNLLLKINASDTANDAKKLGIDLAGTLAAARGKGMNSLDAFVALVDNIVGQDARLVSLRNQAKTAPFASQKHLLDAQADILQGSAIGKIVQDRQALLALVAELNKRDYIQGVKKDVMGANGQFGASNFALVAGTADFRNAQAENEKLIAKTSGLGSVNDALAKLSDGTTDLYRRYPGYATAVETAKWAVTGLAAAAGAAGLAQWALARQAGVAAAAAGAGGAAAAGAGGAAAAGAAAGGIGMGTVGGVVLGGGVAATVLAGSVVASNSEAFANMSADAGDTSFAAAIINAQKEGQAQRDAEAAERADLIRAFGQKPIKLYIDGREIAAQVEGYMSLDARRK